MNKDRVFVILSMLLCLLGISKINAQDKLRISSGVGLPELLNIGIRVPIRHNQLGLTFGSVPVENEKIVSITGDFYLPFGEPLMISNLKRGYLRFSLNFIHNKTESAIHDFTNVGFRIGREFDFTTHLGLDLDIGLLIQLSHHVKWLQYYPFGAIDLDIPIMPAASLNFFYRF